MSSSTSRLLVPALRSACVCAHKALSTTVVARQVTGSHLFRIRGYSLIDRMLPAGEGIRSGEFTVANHKWELLYTPNQGISMPTVNIYPFLNEDEETTEVYATYRASILDRDGKPEYSCTVGPRRYITEWVEEDDPTGELVSSEELRRSMDRLVDDDDCLNLRYDVNVLELEPEPHIRTDDA